MKAFVILSALVSMAMARPGLVPVGPVPTLQSRVSASASATSSSSPQQLSLLRLLPNTDGRGLDSFEQLSLSGAGQGALQQQILGFSPLVSASSSASASSLSPTVVTADGRVVNSLNVDLANAVRAQAINGANPLLSTTSLAQSLASLSPTGAASSSSVQVLDSPELRAARLQQNLFLGQGSGIQSNGLPVFLGTDGQVVSSPLVVF